MAEAPAEAPAGAPAFTRAKATEQLVLACGSDETWHCLHAALLNSTAPTLPTVGKKRKEDKL
jgi:hypothetical protein